MTRGDATALSGPFLSKVGRRRTKISHQGMELLVSNFKDLGGV